jgi:hypothetical protein
LAEHPVCVRICVRMFPSRALSLNFRQHHPRQLH